ncbi:TraV family lipoprotein [Candidatus Rariloculus sp.]|uniref:TraV family lipoprotein n=1 Tax=Candidatus Rariloculus sp. TaxID=3101265 RepID=UPI003D0F6973
MTVLDRTAVRVLVGTLVALALGGCAATNVGNSWQCPIVQGSVCARVAEADPAAPKRVSMGTPADTVTATQSSAVRARPFRTRRYRNGTGARVPATRAAPRARESEPTCQGTCRLSDRLAWGAGSTDEEPEDRRDTQAEAGSDGDRLQPAGLPPAGLPPAGSWRDSARTPEVLGRIWIAPYVDTAGVYHEPSWVRVVIEPAGWRQAP